MSPGAAAAAAVVLVMIVVIVLVVKIIRIAPGGLAGWWATADGDLFEVRTQNGGYLASTSSGYMGARTGGAYPLATGLFRSVTIALPGGALTGRVGYDKRRLLLNNGDVWHRQGL